MAEPLARFGCEILYLRIGKDVGKASHAHGMRDLLELVERGAPDAPRRGIVAGELRIFFFKRDELIEELIIFIVGYLRRIFYIIQAGVMLDRSAKLFRPFFFARLRSSMKTSSRGAFPRIF